MKKLENQFRFRKFFGPPLNPQLKLRLPKSVRISSRDSMTMYAFEFFGAQLKKKNFEKKEKLQLQ